MPGSGLMRQVGRTGNGAIAHANANSSAGKVHSRPLAAREARRRESLKLPMRDAKYVFPENGSTLNVTVFHISLAGRDPIMRDEFCAHRIVIDFAGAAAGLWPSPTPRV